MEVEESQEDEKTKKQKIWDKKQKLKEAFNQEYDDKGDPTAGFFEEWKKETEAIAARNKRYFLTFKPEIKAFKASFLIFPTI